MEGRRLRRLLLWLAGLAVVCSFAYLVIPLSPPTAAPEDDPLLLVVLGACSNVVAAPSTHRAVVYEAGGGVGAACVDALQRRGVSASLLVGATLVDALRGLDARGGPPARLVLVDSNTHAPLSTFVAHSVLPLSSSLEVRTVDVEPRGPVDSAGELRRLSLLAGAFARLPTLTKQVEAAGFLREQGWGYHPERMEPRWRAIARSLRTMQPKPRAAAYAVDWGSNEGYFSVRLGQELGPLARILSIEAEVDEYSGVRNRHRAHAERERVTNNELCNSKVTGDEFELLRLGRSWHWDVQLSLSVMHWLDYTTHESFLRKLGWLLYGARTTFLELPEVRAYGHATGQTRAEQLNRWYGGLLDEEKLVRKALDFVAPKAGDAAYRIRSLGPMFHQTGTVRVLLRVDVEQHAAPVISWETVRGDVFACPVHTSM